MASEGGGKIKFKRGHSSNKPYNRRKSLFQRITDSIKDVLRPSWLPGESSDDPTISEDHGAASSDEGDDQFMSPVQSPSQLAGKQGHGTGTNEPRLYPQLPQVDLSDVPVNTTIPWQQGSADWQRQGVAGRSTWGPNSAPFENAQFCKNYFAQKHIASTKQAEAAPEIPPSPRGLGGPAPPESSSAATSTITRKIFFSESSMSSSLSGQMQNNSMAGSVAAPGISASSSESPEDNPSKRQRLWSPHASRKGRSLQPAVKDRPAFKISVFGSPNLNESLHESPFYSGKTTYGGASAYRRQSMNSSLPYQNSLPLRKSVKAKPLNSSGNAVLSSSATQILKTLERLSDTKRSRANETETESLLSFTPSSYRKPSRPLQTGLPSRSLELPVRGPPTRQLNTAMAASIARNRQIVSLPARRPHPPASTITGSQQDDGEQEGASDDEDVQVVDLSEFRGVKEKRQQNLQKDFEKKQTESVTNEGPASRASGKMKHAKSYDNRPKAAREEDEVVEIPNLRTDFTLPINSMPGFNFGHAPTPVASACTPSVPAAAPVSSPTPGAGSKRTSLVSNQSPPKLQFTFSSPIQKSGPESSGSSPAPAEGFQFSSPLKVTQSITASSDKADFSTGFGVTSSSSMTSFNPAHWGSTAPKPKASVTESVQSSPAGGSMGNKSTSSLLFGSSETSATGMTSSSGGSFKPAAQLKSGSVMDILGGSKTSEPSPFGSGSGLQPAAQLKRGSVMDILGSKSSSQSASSASSKSSGGDSLFAKFAPAAGSWDCDACMLQNKPDAAKCVACETPKPGAKKNAESAPPQVTSGDSLFAKFAAPVGSWECDACMLQNKPDTTKCVACETPKPGSAPAKATPPSDDLMAKFRMPAGGWECDVCMVQNTATHTKCLACETPRPGTQATAPAKATPSSDDLMTKFRMPAGGWECDVCMVQNTATHTKCLACETPRPGTQATGSAPAGAASFVPPASSSSAPCPFLSAGSPSQQSVPSSGFKFVPTSSSSSSTGGFQFGSMSSGATVPSGNGGFKFGNQDTSNSNSASSPATGFKFGAKDSADSNGSSATKESGFKFGADAAAKPAVSAPASGFQFGSPPASSAPSSTGGFAFGGPSGTSTTQTTTPTPSAGFSFGSSIVGSTGLGFGSSAAQSQSKDSTAKSNDKLTSPATSDSGKEGSVSSCTFSPVFGAGKPSNTFALGAAPSLAASGGSSNTLTSGGFQLGASTPSSGPSVFGASLTSKVTLPGGDTSKSESDGASSKLPAMPGGFSFGAIAKTNSDTVAKPGLFASALGDSNSQNGPSVTPASSTAPQGFGFSGPGASNTSASSNPFSATPQLSTGVFGGVGAAPVKPVVNGELGAPSLLAFSQQSTAGSSSTAGFSFGATTANAKESSKLFAFGSESSAKSSSEKRRLDNDLGQTEAKKRSFNLAGAPGTGDGEPFKFGSTASTAGNNNLFKFGATTEGPVDKAPSNTVFGGQASGFGGAATQGGFSFSNPQTNAASSTGAPTQQASSVFGAGAGSTNMFSMGAGAMSNAAAASSFGSGASASQGFNFGGSIQTGFSAPVFNFGTQSQSADPAPAQSAGVFLFGSGQPSADTNSQPPSFTTPSAGSFAATAAQNNFSIGTGDGRKMKRAVRRTVRK